jgi:glutamate synthase (NADPH/NADH) small chain
MWSHSTVRFIGRNNHITGAEIEEVRWVMENGKYTMQSLPETRRIISADLVILALGFLHPVHEGLLTELGLELDERKNIKTRDQLTSQARVFAAGDAASGASLVVNAIASGRRAARMVDKFLRS